MTSERDDYDVFLDSWVPSAILRYATLPINLNDPVVRQHLVDDSTAEGDLVRTAYAPGHKAIAVLERALRAYEFFETHHAEWSAHFRDRVESAGVDAERLQAFTRYFRTLWIDGLNRRQGSGEMLSIKASIRDHDHFYHGMDTGQFVLENLKDGIPSMFTPAEMAAIFEANAGLMDAFIPDYLDHLGNAGPGSINELYVRRGVWMPGVDETRIERHYLSSYSFALTPVEQFAQTWTPTTRDSGVPSIFSAPLPAIQQRIVAFAPFIEGMDLSQLELVVAPPVERTPLQFLGTHGDIREFEFE